MQGLVGGSVYNTMRTGAETVPQQTLNNSSVPLGNTQLDGERPRGWAQEACVRQLLPWDCCFSTRAEGPKPPPPPGCCPQRESSGLGHWPRLPGACSASPAVGTQFTLQSGWDPTTLGQEAPTPPKGTGLSRLGTACFTDRLRVCWPYEELGPPLEAPSLSMACRTTCSSHFTLEAPRSPERWEQPGSKGSHTHTPHWVC